MDKLLEHKAKRVPININKDVSQAEGNVYFSKLMGVTKSQNKPGLVTLDQLFKNEAKPDERPTSAIFMVFGYHIKNIFPLYSTGTKVIMLADPRIDDYEDIKTNENKDKNLKILWVKKDPLIKTSAFHPKLYLLKFNSFLRVIVGSGNLFLEDWTTWSNVLWMKDFYVRPEGSTSKSCDFKRQLETFVKASMGDKYNDLKSFLGIDFKDYNFSKAGVELLYSLPVKRDFNTGELCGFEMLESIMTKHKPSKPFEFKDTRIYYSCSCIGAVNFGIVYQFVTSIAPNLKSPQFLDYNMQKKYTKMLKLIYPTQSYINGLTSKNNNTACLFFNKKIYHKISFNIDLLTQFENNEAIYSDENFVSHSKIFVVLRNSKVDDDTVIYIGSHNFTKSAWGKISRNRYEVWNHELGVVFPPEANSSAMKKEIISKLSFQVPANKYDEDDEPFFTADK